MTGICPTANPFPSLLVMSISMNIHLLRWPITKLCYKRLRQHPPYEDMFPSPEQPFHDLQKTFLLTHSLPTITPKLWMDILPSSRECWCLSHHRIVANLYWHIGPNYWIKGSLAWNNLSNPWLRRQDDTLWSQTQSLWYCWHQFQQHETKPRKKV